MPRDFHIVDVFAERPYAGNPLAVVIGAEGLSDQTMQMFAAEINYSETTFVTSTPASDQSYRTRIFTPAREIAFAGHPILGTAWVVRHHLQSQHSEPIVLQLPVGNVPVSFESPGEGAEVLWFLAPPVAHGATCAPDRIAPALGLAPEDIDDRTPVQQCSARISALLVPLRSLSALQRSQFDLRAFAPLLADGFPPLVYLFCGETHRPQNDLRARFFFEAHGAREDPATGNAAAFFGTYLSNYRVYPGPDFSLRIEQGYEVRRPSATITDPLAYLSPSTRVLRSLTR